jgi:hypothetical protein
MLEANNYSFHANDYQPVEYTTKQVELKLPLDSTLLVELNLLESPTQQQMAWYLDLNATHLVNGNSVVFASFH